MKAVAIWTMASIFSFMAVGWFLHPSHSSNIEDRNREADKSQESALAKEKAKNKNLEHTISLFELAYPEMLRIEEEKRFFKEKELEKASHTIKVLNQKLVKNAKILTTTQEKLETLASNYTELEWAYQVRGDTVQLLAESLINEKNIVAKKNIQIAQLTPLAGRTVKAERKIIFYQLGIGILACFITLFFIGRNWKRNHDHIQIPSLEDEEESVLRSIELQKQDSYY